MDKKFLIIDSRPYGFFSIFLHTIDNIKWAEDNGYIPVVRWGPGRRDPNHGRPGALEASQKGDSRYVGHAPNFLTDASPISYPNSPPHKHSLCLYYGKDGYNNSKHPWEYYFNPINEYSIEQAEAAPHDIADIFLVGNHDNKIETKFLISNIHSYGSLILWKILGYTTEEKLHDSFEYKHRKMVWEYINKYVSIKTPIQNKIDKFYNKYFSDKVLGVHVRGTDKKSENPYKPTYKALTLDDYISESEKYLSTHSDYKIFLASDNNEAVLRFAQKFGKDKLIVYPSIRMQGYYENVPICLSEVTGPKHGEEVLIETVLLSKTKNLICTDSNVAAGAAYFNPDMMVNFLNSGR